MSNTLEVTKPLSRGRISLINSVMDSHPGKIVNIKDRSFALTRKANEDGKFDFLEVLKPLFSRKVLVKKIVFTVRVGANFSTEKIVCSNCLLEISSKKIKLVYASDRVYGKLLTATDLNAISEYSSIDGYTYEFQIELGGLTLKKFSIQSIEFE